VAAAVVAADLLAGWWARAKLAHHGVHVVGAVWLRLGFNGGVAFSIGNRWPAVATMVAYIVVVAVGVVGIFAKPGAPRVGFGLMLGGGIGNILDRLLTHGRGVTDYVAVSSFPRFNVADAAVTVGFVVLILLTLRGRSLVSAK
jgi:signal peptidase II